MNRLFKKEGSFLIEAMLAIVILSCALVVLIRSYTLAMTAAVVQKDYAQAVILVQNELDDMLSKGFARPAVAHRISIDEQTFEVSVLLAPVTGRHLQRAQITVGWPADAAKRRVVTASTYLLQPENNHAP